MTYDPIMIDALIADAREDMHRNASSWRVTDRVRVNSLLDALQSAQDEISRLRAALRAACDLGEPLRGTDDPRLTESHQIELLPVFTTGVGTRERLHERWAELRKLAGES
jgi:hypothetical protein